MALNSSRASVGFGGPVRVGGIKFIMHLLDRIIEIQSSLLRVQRYALRVSSEVEELYTKLEPLLAAMELESPPRSVDSQREFQCSILFLDRHRAARWVADEVINERE
eukprot:scaffold84962_cov44-Attheya_sp.AAC.1